MPACRRVSRSKKAQPQHTPLRSLNIDDASIIPIAPYTPQTKYPNINEVWFKGQYLGSGLARMTETCLRRRQSGNSSQQRQVRRDAKFLQISIPTHEPGKAVANFFTPISKKEPEKMTWRIVNNSLLVGRYAASAARSAASGKTRIAVFDFVRQHM